MNTSDNLIIDKDEETKKRFHSFRAKTSDQDEDEEHSKRKWQKLRNNYFRDKSQLQEYRHIKECRSESSEDK